MQSDKTAQAHIKDMHWKPLRKAQNKAQPGESETVLLASSNVCFFDPLRT